jgi:hypothetical protein
VCAIITANEARDGYPIISPATVAVGTIYAPPSVQEGTEMARSENSITVEGTVQQGSLDAMHLSHRVCIVSADGHTYEVEPSFVGRYLERLEGHHVIAQVHPVIDGNNRSVVRILTLKVLDRAAASSSCKAEQGTPSNTTENLECVLSEPELDSGTTLRIAGPES